MGEPNNPLAQNDTHRLAVDTYGGKVHIEWDPSGADTPFGQLVFFVEFLKTGGLFDPWVDDSPLRYTSNNAPEKRDVLGTVLLSVLAGHHRYSHITTVRSDNVNPGLVGMNKVVSEDAVRRAFNQMDETPAWIGSHIIFNDAMKH